jgi:hypothetical protein
MLLSEAEMATHLLGLVDGVRARLPTVTLEALFEALEVKRIDAAPPTGQEGLYVRELGAVFLNPAIRTLERRVFTGFHEGTHAIVDRDPLLREQLAELCSDDKSERRVVEMLCDIGAAEFLMPREAFVPLVRAHDSPVRCIEAVERQFPGASLPAIAQQIAHYASPPGLVLVCADAPIPRPGGFERARVHVQYAFIRPVSGSARVRPRPKRYQVVKADHPLSSMFQDTARFSGETYYPYATDRRIPCWCEAEWHAPSQRVVALLTERTCTRPSIQQASFVFE